MQPHNSDDQRAPQGDSDGGRDNERSAAITAAFVAIAKALNVGNGSVHLAEPGKPVNLSANIAGTGGLAA